MQGFRVTVELGERSYPVVAGWGVLAELPALLPQVTRGSRLLLVTHPALLAAYGEDVIRGLEAAGFSVTTALVSPGERSKSLAMAGRLYREMAGAGLDRRSAVIALGGGVIGDLAGFAAATWLRGIDVIQVPTTLLAMVDSSIGGKTGVNTPVGKNLVGAFHQPRAVVADAATLATLPKRDVRSGMAEVIKYGVIADAGLFAYLERHVADCLSLEQEAISRVIADSVACKARVVSEDEREGGLRAILNFGHTAGHAIEKAAGYRKLRHGEAVSIGMVAAARIGRKMGITPEQAARRIENLLVRAGLPVRIPKGLDPTGLVASTAYDKKAVDGRARWVLASDIGSVERGVAVPEDTVEAVLRELMT
jgi:3-dehydroquinate synthase